MKDIEPSEGFEYVKTEDKIKIDYLTLEADNFLQANTKLKDHNDIITIGNFENIECETTSSFLSNSIAIVALSSIAVIVGYFFIVFNI